MKSRRVLPKRSILILLLAATALLTYAQSLKNDFVIWDDDSLVYQNPLTQEMTFKTIAGAFSSYDPELYVPLTIISFQLEHAIFGFAPFFFHFDNVLLHIIACSLVFLFLEKLGLRRTTAFVAALVFAVHPINTEAVAWVSARKDLLCAVFSLSALLTYMRYRRQGNNSYLWMTFGFLSLALLSKPLAIVLPFIFILLDWKESGRVRKSDVVRKIPFFLLSVLFLAIGLYGKTRNISALSAVETLLLAMKSTAFALQKYLWPDALSPLYLQTDPISIILPQFFITLVIIIGLTGLALWSLRKTKVFAFSGLFFLLFLLPSFSNFAKENSVYFFSDRYVYLSQIGILFLAGYVLDRFLERDRFPRTPLSMGVLLGITWIGTLAFTAHAQSLLWKDSETLYRDALTKNDRSVVMHYNLAVLEHRRGNRPEALAEYQKTLALDPQYAKALSNIGVWYKENGDSPKAMEYFRRAAQSDPTSPEPYNNIGSVLMDQGDIDGAIAEFRKAVATRERFAQAHINLAAALGRKGLYEEGLREYKRAFELAPQLLDGLPEIKRALENLPVP